jgi:hypothetical protein
MGRFCVVGHMGKVAVKPCAVCGQMIRWQPKLAGCWERMRYCGPRCRRHSLDEVDRALEHAILGLLSCRPVGGTIIPAEAARLVADGGRWWRLVERAHWAVRRLVAEDRLEVVTGAGDGVGAPLRVRLPRGLCALPSTAAV